MPVWMPVTMPQNRFVASSSTACTCRGPAVTGLRAEHFGPDHRKNSERLPTEQYPAAQETFAPATWARADQEAPALWNTVWRAAWATRPWRQAQSRRRHRIFAHKGLVKTQRSGSPACGRPGYAAWRPPLLLLARWGWHAHHARDNVYGGAGLKCQASPSRSRHTGTVKTAGAAAPAQFFALSWPLLLLPVLPAQGKGFQLLTGYMAVYWLYFAAG